MMFKGFVLVFVLEFDLVLFLVADLLLDLGFTGVFLVVAMRVFLG